MEPASPVEQPVSVPAQGRRASWQRHPVEEGSFVQACGSGVGLQIFLVLRPHLETGKRGDPSPNHKSPLLRGSVTGCFITVCIFDSRPTWGARKLQPVKAERSWTFELARSSWAASSLPVSLPKTR